MKIRVTVDGRTFEVDVQDPHARPVVAVVEGEQFEVWPEDVAAHAAPAPKPAVMSPIPSANGTKQTRDSAPTQPAARPGAHAVVAPIPGVIISVAVQAGQQVTAGEELCMLEAMKMQNSIRAPRDGMIVSVRASAGQHVRHREVLMEYEP